MLSYLLLKIFDFYKSKIRLTDFSPIHHGFDHDETFTQDPRTPAKKVLTKFQLGW